MSKAFAETKLAEGAPVGPHVIKMVGYTQRLEKLGFPLGQELATDFILTSLPPSYGNFVSNYHMHRAEKGLNELCGMLKTAESDIKKSTGDGCWRFLCLKRIDIPQAHRSTVVALHLGVFQGIVFFLRQALW